MHTSFISAAHPSVNTRYSRAIHRRPDAKFSFTVCIHKDKDITGILNMPKDHMAEEFHQVIIVQSWAGLLVSLLLAYICKNEETAKVPKLLDLCGKRQLLLQMALPHSLHVWYWLFKYKFCWSKRPPFKNNHDLFSISFIDITRKGK